MRHHDRVRRFRLAAFLACAIAVPAAAHAADPQLKAKKAEAKRLLNLGKTAETQGNLTLIFDLSVALPSLFYGMNTHAAPV